MISACISTTCFNWCPGFSLKKRDLQVFLFCGHCVYSIVNNLCCSQPLFKTCKIGNKLESDSVLHQNFIVLLKHCYWLQPQSTACSFSPEATQLASRFRSIHFRSMFFHIHSQNVLVSASLQNCFGPLEITYS